MSTPKKTRESCIPTWYGQHLERATVLSTAHIATMDAALAGIQAVVDVLHDRESQRYTGEAMHCPEKAMGLLAAVHSLATLIRLHTSENTEMLPDFILDTQGVQELCNAANGHWLRSSIKRGKSAEWVQAQQAQHQQDPQANQPQTRTHQARTATKTVATKPIQQGVAV